ncbi:hypothetical protein QTP86_018775, partial [Hemibagrus guttatus]
MILNNRDEDLNVIFKTKCDGGEYTIYATSGSLKCFGCAQEGHLVRNCPEEQAAGEQETGTVTENIQEREQGENKQDSGEDNTQTEDQEENKQQETTTESQEGRKDTETEVNHMESENEQSQGDMNKDTENSTQLANSQNTEECEGTDMTVDDSGFTAVRDQPKVSSEDNAALEGPLVLEELHAALSTMSGGKAPGVDSLPLELYKFLWKELGEDLLEVLEESRRERCLSLSSRRAVITLLPKKGDLQDIKNWRPVSLLCTDYKVMSKALANRLRDIMDFVIQTDQTYCVPNRSIIDNVSLIRDILDVSRSLVVDLGLISLDQEKAFDRVEHQYLWKTLEAFGLSPSLIAMIKVLYQDVESVLKINGGLSAPFKVQRGIRQGCSLSAWTLFKRGSQGPAVSLYWLLEEPLVGGGRMDIKDSSPGLAHITHSKRLVDTAGPEVKDTKEVEEEPEVTTGFVLISLFSIAEMASRRETPLLPLRLGFRCVPEESVMLEDVLIALENTPDISFHVKHEGRTFMIYASTGNMKCFECGDIGHKRLACPHKGHKEVAVTDTMEENRAASQMVNQEGTTERVEDADFREQFRCFWEHWKTTKNAFENLRQWWDFGKVEIKLLCQQHTANSSTKVKQAIKALEREIMSIETQLTGLHDPNLLRTLHQKRKELGSYLDGRVKGALVRSRFTTLEDMDAPSAFFFNLERSTAQHRQMVCLRLPDGRVTTDITEMRQHAVDFYSGLYTAEDCDLNCTEQPPQIDPESKAVLDSDLTLEELTTAVNQLCSARSPGIDGLHSEFFKHFWNCIVGDFFEVLHECSREGFFYQSHANDHVLSESLLICIKFNFFNYVSSLDTPTSSRESLDHLSFNMLHISEHRVCFCWSFTQ